MLFASELRDRFVSLGTGLVVPAESLMVTLDLEARGFTLQPDAGDLIVSPFSALTAEDTRQIRRWKHHIIAILSCTADDSRVRGLVS